jgi:ribonuclease HI
LLDAGPANYPAEPPGIILTRELNSQQAPAISQQQPQEIQVMKINLPLELDISGNPGFNPTRWTCIPGAGIYIFTDGSYKKSTNKTGAGIYLGPTAMNLYINMPVDSTNNQAELFALYLTLKIINVSPQVLNDLQQPLTIISDSKYSIDSITKWYKSWVKNGWKTADGSPVKNKELLIAIQTEWKNANNTAKQGGWSIKIEHQFSHKSAPIGYPASSKEYIIWQGNDIADKIASCVIPFSLSSKTPVLTGPRQEYC